jgi:hypothetical protein
MSDGERAWVLAAPPGALECLRPLVRAHERVRPVLVREVEPHAGPSELEDVLARAEAVLLVGSRRRSPRTALPGPFLAAPDGRAVPAGWLPDLGLRLESFARAAARVARRSASVGPVALLGQWDARFLHLAERMEVRLRECASSLETVRWTAERITRAHVVRGLRYGVGAAVYFGHGRPEGWAGYHGLRARHLVGDGGEPLGAVLSVTCLTASRWRTGLAFSEEIATAGVAAGAFGAVSPVAHLESMRWMLGLADALRAGERLLGPALVRAAPDGSAGGPYRILGDPLAALVGAPRAAARAARVFAPAPDLAAPVDGSPRCLTPADRGEATHPSGSRPGRVAPVRGVRRRDGSGSATAREAWT